jgi:hypothetical protein
MKKFTGLVLGFSALLLTGCGDNTEKNVVKVVSDPVISSLDGFYICSSAVKKSLDLDFEPEFVRSSTTRKDASYHFHWSSMRLHNLGRAKCAVNKFTKKVNYLLVDGVEMVNESNDNIIPESMFTEVEVSKPVYNSENEHVGTTQADALLNCQKRIKRYGMFDGRVPVVDAWGSRNDPEFHFSWGKGSLPKNISAYCAVNKVSGKITSLTLNGQKFK